MKKYTEEPHDGMEAPCRCQCGNWFDLDDGYRDLSNENNLVCQACRDIQDEEKEREEEIDALKDEISDAEYTIRANYKRLNELKAIILKPVAVKFAQAVIGDFKTGNSIIEQDSVLVKAYDLFLNPPIN